MFTLYCSNTCGSAKNCSYPLPVTIDSEEALREAVCRDYTAGKFRGSRRGIDNFLEADCLIFDVDNTHSDDPNDWIVPDDLKKTFPGVEIYLHYSRSHMKAKNGKAPRPKFHVFMPISPVGDASRFSAMMRAAVSAFPYFDSQALDAGRFFFGTEKPEVEKLSEGGLFDPAKLPQPRGNGNERIIPAGERNSTMYSFALKVLKRYGLCKRARELFDREAECCSPPLDLEELNSIWLSATKYAVKIMQGEDYLSPEEYESLEFRRAETLEPADFSDIGEAKVFTREYSSEILYSDATDFLKYDGICWAESRQKAVGSMEEFLDLQLAEAEERVEAALADIVSAGVDAKDALSGGKRFANSLTASQLSKYEVLLAALAYRNFVMKRRDMRYIISGLQAAKPMVEIDVKKLDSDPFLFNTPEATYDLRLGVNGAREHSPKDLITKTALCEPGNQGMQIWKEALDTFFCHDAELIEYVQEIVGLAAIGKVMKEALIIAYGSGKNGKSSFWNTISKVLGTYSGALSADALTVGCKRNVKPEMAELHGKRLVISAELEEGMRLNTSIVKQLCSTDEITAERKYRDPFKYTPSHTLVLYTNHLPRVGATDDGTWRRLIVIPFNAVISANTDRKNYSDFLVENAAPYILSWILEGAQKAIRNNYEPPVPMCVADAVSAYRDKNDWLGNFILENCEVKEGAIQKSGDFYLAYRDYCLRNGEYVRSTSDFASALEQAGFTKIKKRDGMYILGISLKDEFLAE